MSEVLEMSTVLDTKVIKPPMYKVVLVKKHAQKDFFVKNQIFDKLVELFSTTRAACLERFEQANKNKESSAFNVYSKEIAEARAEQANLILEELVSHQGVLIFLAMPDIF